jgi:putative ABC transport system permease protein
MRWYRTLLRLFPRAWRERYGSEVLQLIAEDESRSLLRPSIDLVRSGIAERVRQFHRLVWSGVRFARGRTVALGAGLMVAAVAFSLLTASVDVGTARIQGVVGQHWRGAYDLLVLPARSGDSVTAPGHVVEANYLSAAAGGITTAQYRRIAALPGVGVAAPLEIVGYVLETATVPVNVAGAAGGAGARVLDLTSRFTADDGLSVYPAQQQGYVYVTPDPLTALQISQRAQLVGQVERLPGGRSVIVCPAALGGQPAQTSPFQSGTGLLSGSCYSRQSTPSRAIEGYVTWSFPVLVAGIDPAAENDLTGLGGAIISGRYLHEGEGATLHAPDPADRALAVPVIASTASFDGDDDQVTVSALPASAVQAARSEQPARIASVLSSDKAVPVLRVAITGAEAWAQLLSQLGSSGTAFTGSNAQTASFAQTVGQYWTAGPVSYRPGAPGLREVVPVTNPESVWDSGINIMGRSYVFAPPAAADTGFRPLSEHLWAGAGAPLVVLQRVGEFDPYRLAGFSGQASPLASYRAPVLTGADRASRSALSGQPLEPDGNLAGFAQQPPLLLTTLAGAGALEDPGNFSGTAAQSSAPIGSIRVRVSGLRGTVPEQLGKIASVGEEIAKTTGLRVVVTAGSSPQLVTVGLPAGKFGRPPLQLSDDWTAVLVALVILRQADKESLALFVLILVVCGLFLAGAALAAVRSRREEIAVLRALGWGRSQVFALVLGEVAMLGLAAGIAGVVVSFLLVKGLRLDVPLWHAVLVLPVAVLLAVLSGLVPAWLAARTEPAGGFAPAVRAPRRGGRPVRSITSMAITGVYRTPGRCALAATALAAGVTGLAVLLAAQVSFVHSIGDSALAGLVTASARATDLESALLAVGLGAASVADITYLNLRERAAELAALAASGWDRVQLGRLLVTEAFVTAAAGSAVGAAAGLLVAADAFGLSVPVIVGAAAAAGVGVLAALLCTGGVLGFSGGRSLTAALATDE